MSDDLAGLGRIPFEEEFVFVLFQGSWHKDVFHQGEPVEFVNDVVNISEANEWAIDLLHESERKAKRFLTEPRLLLKGIERTVGAVTVPVD